MQTPHPQSPDLPMAADPRLDLTPYLYRTLEALQKEMSYAGRYRPIDPTDEPSTRSDKQLSKQLRGTPQAAPQAPGSASTTGLPSGDGLPSGGVQLDQAAPSYQSSPTQYAPQSQPAEAPQGNPWESAFNKVMNVLSTPVQSPFQDQSSAGQTQYAPVNSAQQSNAQATQQLDPQTLSANEDTWTTLPKPLPVPH